MFGIFNPIKDNPATCVYSGNNIEWDAVYCLNEFNETYYDFLFGSAPEDHSGYCSFHNCYEVLSSAEDAEEDGGEVVEFEYAGGRWGDEKEHRIVQLPKNPLDRECDCYEGWADHVWYSDKEFQYDLDKDEWSAHPEATLLFVYNQNENTVQLTKSPKVQNRGAASICYPEQTCSDTEGGYNTYCMPDEYLSDYYLEQLREERESDE